jgi:hypothetical protein
MLTTGKEKSYKGTPYKKSINIHDTQILEMKAMYGCIIWWVIKWQHGRGNFNAKGWRGL